MSSSFRGTGDDDDNDTCFDQNDIHHHLS